MMAKALANQPEAAAGAPALDDHRMTELVYFRDSRGFVAELDRWRARLEDKRRQPVPMAAFIRELLRAGIHSDDVRRGLGL